MTRTSWTVLILATTACNCESGPRPGPPEAPQPDRRAMRSHMRAHFDAAADLHRAVVDGRLADAREMAAWLGRHDDRLDPPAPRERELEYAADTIVHAKDLTAAAGGMARLGRACGSCHASYRARVDLGFGAVALPPEAPTLEAQMARHAWAAERMWEGVIVPDDVAWREGAAVMGTSTFDLSRTTNAKPNERVVELAEQMRDLAGAAQRGADPEVRATIHGAMLVTCASCHAIVRARPVAAQRE